MMRICGALVVALLYSGISPAADKDGLVRLDMELSDDSRLIGTTTLETFRVENKALGKIDIKLKMIQEIEVNPKTGEVEVCLWGHDLLRGSVDIATIPLSTLCGKVNVPMKHVRYVAVFHPDNLKEGLVAHYALDGDARDKSGNKNHGKVKGATPAKDRFGNPRGALSFDGKDDFVDLGADEAFNFEEAFTVSAWVKCNTRRPELCIYSSSNPNVLDNTRISLQNDMFVVAMAKDEAIELAEQGALPPGKWVHCVGTFEGERAAVFLNGEGRGEKELEGELPPATGNAIGKLGANRGFMDGVIDDVRIYDRALSGLEVRELYKMEKGQRQPAGG